MHGERLVGGEVAPPLGEEAAARTRVGGKVDVHLARERVGGSGSGAGAAARRRCVVGVAQVCDPHEAALLGPRAKVLVELGDLVGAAVGARDPRRQPVAAHRVGAELIRAQRHDGAAATAAAAAAAADAAADAVGGDAGGGEAGEGGGGAGVDLLEGGSRVDRHDLLVAEEAEEARRRRREGGLARVGVAAHQRVVVAEGRRDVLLGAALCALPVVDELVDGRHRLEPALAACRH